MNEEESGIPERPKPPGGFVPMPRPQAAPAAPKLQTPPSMKKFLQEAQESSDETGDTEAQLLPDTPTPASLQEHEREAVGVLDMLKALVSNDGSDLHISAGSPIKIRINGRLRNMIVNGAPLVLSAEEARRVLLDITTNEQAAYFDENHELDFAYDYPGLARFRVNYFYARTALRGVFRIIPHKIKTLEELGMPPVLKKLASMPRGLVLVTGPTGSGKSTTLAAMMDYINETREEHVLTIEDPIEFVHESKKCLISQRELHMDTYSFHSALRAALREDPDVILVGEMRDPETIELGLTAAETGHLVFATLHTQDASQTIDRLVDSFPPDQQHQIRSQLSLALQGVVSQQLLRTKDGNSRIAALEIMLTTPGVRNMLRENKTAQIYSAMQTGAAEGMQTMEMCLANLIKEGKITKQVAAAVSSNPKELDNIVTGAMRMDSKMPGDNPPGTM